MKPQSTLDAVLWQLVRLAMVNGYSDTLQADHEYAAFSSDTHAGNALCGPASPQNGLRC